MASQHAISHYRMKIKKLGHCCLLIENEGVRVLTDPGAWNDGTDTVTGLDALVITHEHSDHLHLPSVKTVLENNPGVRIISNASVAALLSNEGISCEIVGHEAETEVKGMKLKGFGNEHEEIYGALGKVENTGYLFAEKFYYPGDSFYKPNAVVEILAVPVCGPWMRIKECIDFVKALTPKISFPVHDGMLKIYGPFHAVPEKLLLQENIGFTVLLPGEEKEF